MSAAFSCQKISDIPGLRSDRRNRRKARRCLRDFTLAAKRTQKQGCSAKTQTGGKTVKKVGKPVFFIIVLLIAAMGYLTVAGVTTVYGDSTTRAIKGIDDVRWGIDIRGGVDAVSYTHLDVYKRQDK